MKKKLISLLLVLALLCAIMPSALAASIPFSDVPKDAWYRSAVEFVYENQLFYGTSDTEFSPNSSMTRGMLVSVLWRQAGTPEPSGSSPFTDLKENWYRDAVQWAYENEVVYGVSETSFAPDQSVTREQMVAILYRYARNIGYACSESNSLNAFTDRGAVAEYAQPAFRWAVGAGVISGVSSTRLDPASTATRAQVASIMMRFVALMDDDPDNDPASPASPDAISVGGKSYYLGMTVSQLTGQAGQPSEQLPTLDGYTWYVYGADTYQNFFLAGVSGNQVVALCASGPGFSYMGHQMGDGYFSVAADDDVWISLMFDKNDNDIFHCVLLMSADYDGSASVSKEALAGESKVDFHLANAFRVYHGVGILTWDDRAAAAARLHSEDMAANNYFDHYSQDGRDPGDRIEAQGIDWWSYGENIDAGYPSGIAAHNGWVNSAGHRGNILDPDFKYLGVGFGYQRGSYYGIYATEDYFS